MPYIEGPTKAEAVPRTRSLREQSAWLLAAKIVGFALSFFLPLLIVRSLTQENVGHYRESFQIIANAVILLPLGFSMSAYYFLARETDRRGAAVFNILIFNIVVGGVACLTLWVYPQILGAVFQTSEMTRLAPKIGVVIWIWIVSTFLETIPIANQEARAATAFIIISSLSKTVFMGAAVVAFATVDAFLYAAMIQGVVQGFILLAYLRSRFPRFWKGSSLAFFREQMAYAIPFGLTGILWLAQTDIHNYFVGYKFSSADFAVYAYGCFEVPLIAMLAESVTSVLIPRMNSLQLAEDREEMIRLTARAMQKLAFFYFPIYVFLLITAKTFIVTLFTERYAASASVFLVNITLLPFSVMITDPVVRSFKELGRIFLLSRICILTCLVGVLYFGLDRLGMIGMISAAVGAMVAEKCIAETMVIYKLRPSLRHLSLLRSIGITALISASSGVVTCLVYSNAHDRLIATGKHMASLVVDKQSTIDFCGGAFVLAVCGVIFGAIYLAAAYSFGVIDPDEKAIASNFVKRFIPKRGTVRVADI